MNFMKFGILTAVLIALAGWMVTAVPASAADDTCGDTYRIERGDTLSKIAKRCGTSLSLLVMANPQIKKPSLIYPGQVLELPRKAVPAGEDSPTVVIRPEADHLTLEQISSLEIDLDSRERWIDIDLSSQTVSAYEGRDVVHTFLVSTGTLRFPTLTGRYWIYAKYETKDMRGPGYFLEDVPYTMFFHKGYALHGTFWHDQYGSPMSHGCVNLSTEDAKWLFDFAQEGTLVNVHH